MSESSGAPRSDLARVLAGCNQRLRSAAFAGSAPILRLERGAGLIHGVRAQHVSALLEPLLALVVPCLYVPPAQPAVVQPIIRPKLRVTLRLGGAGLLAQCRYFGVAPADAELRTLYAPESAGAPSVVAPGYALAAYTRDGVVVASRQSPAALPETVLALAHAPAALADGEICVRAVWHEPARRWPLVRVMAGPREVAVPMFSVKQVLSEDAISDDSPPTRSLAKCLGEQPSPSSLGRPALLVLRRRGPALALRVEALLGHDNEVVHPVGPLLLGAPWILGVIGNHDADPPTLVLDPLALPGLRAE